MQIATWNVNSVRTRLEHVVNWLQSHPNVDVLCLQETKVVDSDFPHQPFTDLGLHTYIYGQKSYNGVAIIARQPLSEIETGFAAVLDDAGDLDEQKRVIAAIANNIRIVNLYVPNGSAVGSDKYEYKLRWLDTLKQYLHTSLANDPRPTLICGDFNVALEDIDIYDASDRADRVMATDAEREALQSVLHLGFKDVFRKFTPEAGHYSWWDYRSGSFQRNRGWRIDYHFVTQDLYERAIACNIDIEPRRLTQPSDHVPVIVEF
jgi:exodeoxyribonuclease-3